MTPRSRGRAAAAAAGASTAVRRARSPSRTRWMRGGAFRATRSNGRPTGGSTSAAGASAATPARAAAPTTGRRRCMRFRPSIRCSTPWRWVPRSGWRWTRRRSTPVWALRRSRAADCGVCSATSARRRSPMPGVRLPQRIAARRKRLPTEARRPAANGRAGTKCPRPSSGKAGDSGRGFEVLRVASSGPDAAVPARRRCGSGARSGRARAVAAPAQATRSRTPRFLSDSTTTVSPSCSLPSMMSDESGSSTLSASVRLSDRTP